jgi:hypothetical protein
MLVIPFVTLMIIILILVSWPIDDNDLIVDLDHVAN